MVASFAGGGSSLGSASGQIIIDAAQALRALDQVGAGLNTLNRSSALSSESVQGVGRGLAGMGAAVLGAFGVGIKTAADFEQRMSAVGAVTGATGQDLDGLRKLALQLGKDTSFSASTSAAAIEELGKAGISIENIMSGAAQGVVDLAAATDTDLVTAATIAANALNQFGLAGDQTVRVADILARGAQQSAADVTTLGDGLRYVGTTANALDIPLEDTVAALAALSDQGLQGSTSGTALNQMLSSLVNPSDKARRAMDQLGISVDDGTGGFKSLTEIIENVRDSTAHLTEVERARYLNQIFGEQGGRAINALLQTQTEEADAAGKSWQDYMDAVEGGSTASEMAVQRLDNLKGSFEQMMGSLETAAIIIGTRFIPAVRAVVDAITAMLNIFLALPSGVQTVLAVITLAAGALSFLAGAAILLYPKLVSMRESFQALNKVLLGGRGFAGIVARLAPLLLRFLGPLGLVITAIQLYRSNFLGFGDAVRKVVGIMGSGIGKVVDVFHDLSDAFREARGHTSDVMDTINRLGGIGNTAAKGLNPVAAAFKAIQVVAGNLGLDRVADAFGSVSRFAEALGQTLTALADYFRFVLIEGDYLNDFLTHLPEPLRNITAVIGGVVTAFRDAIAVLAGGGGFTAAWEALTDVFTNGHFLDALRGVGAALGILPAHFDRLQQTVSQLGATLGSIPYIGSLLEGAFNGAAASIGFLGNHMDEIKAAAQGAADAMGELANAWSRLPVPAQKAAQATAGILAGIAGLRLAARAVLLPVRALGGVLGLLFAPIRLLLAPLKLLTPLVRLAVSPFRLLASTLGFLASPIKAIGPGIRLLTNPMKLLYAAVRLLLSPLSLLRGAFFALSTAIKFFGPIGLVIGLALSAIGLAFTKNWFGIRDKTVAAGRAIGSALADVAGELGALLNAGRDWISGAGGTLTALWDGMLPSLIRAASAVRDFGTALIAGNFQEAATMLSDLARAALDFGRNLVVDLKGWTLNVGLPTLGGAILDIGRDLWGFLRQAAGIAGTVIGTIASWTLNVGLPALGGAIVGFGSNLWGFIQTAAGIAGTFIGEILSWTLNVGAPAVVNLIGDAASWIGDKLAEAAVAVADFASWSWSLAKQLPTGLASAGAWIREQITSFAPNVLAFAGWAWSLAKQLPAIGPVLAWIEEQLTSIAPNISEFAGWAWSLAKKLPTGLASAAAWIREQLASFAPKALAFADWTWSLAKQLPTFVGDVLAWLKDALIACNPNVAAFAEWSWQLAKKIPSLIGACVFWIIEALGTPSIAAFANWAWDLAKKLPGGLGEVASWIGEAIKALAPNVLNFASWLWSLGKKLPTGLANVAAWIGEAIKAVAPNVINFASWVWSVGKKLPGGLAEVSRWIGEAIKAAAPNVLNFASWVWSLGKKLPTFAADVAGWVSEVLTAAAIAVKNFIGWTLELGEPIITGADKLAGWIGGAINEFDDLIVTRFEDDERRGGNDAGAAVAMALSLEDAQRRIATAVALINASLDTLTGRLSTFPETLRIFGESLTNGLVNGMAAPTIGPAEKLAELLQSALDVANAFVPTFTAPGSGIVNNVRTGINTAGPGIRTSLVNHIERALAGVQSFAGQMTTAGSVSLVGSIRNGINSAGPGIRTSLNNHIQTAVTGVRSFAGQMTTAGQLLVSSIRNGVNSAGPGIATSVRSHVQSAISAGRNAAGGASSIGFALGSGIASGINSWAGTVASAAATVVYGAIRAARSAAQAFSPSRRMRLLGRDMGQGLDLGLIDMLREVVRSAQRLARGAIDEVASAVQVASWNSIPMSGPAFSGLATAAAPAVPSYLLTAPAPASTGTSIVINGLSLSVQDFDDFLYVRDFVGSAGQPAERIALTGRR